MIQAYVTDLARAIEFIAPFDCSGDFILVKVYKLGKDATETTEKIAPEFIGVINTVPPYDNGTLPSVVVDWIGSSPEAVGIVTIYGKYRYQEDDAYTILFTQTTNIGNATVQLTYQYDPKDYDDFRVSLNGTDVYGNLSQMIARPLTSIENVIVGDVAGAKIVVPCNFSTIAPGDDYSIIAIAEGKGVIGRDFLIVYDVDGYSV